MSAVGIRLGNQAVAAFVSGDRVQIADRVFTVAAIGGGLYRVNDGNRHWTVAVAGPPENPWIFVDGHVAHVEVDIAGPKSRANSPGSGNPSTRGRPPVRHELASPMPATVIRVLVKEGLRVARGDTLILLEAMKMELPIRAPRDGIVRAVHCVPGELVQPDVNLLDFE